MKKIFRSKIILSSVLAFSMIFSASAAEIGSLIPIGHTVGIQMESDGIMIVRLSEVTTASGTVSPARDAGLAAGDIILSVNGNAVASNDELQKQIALSTDEAVQMEVLQSDGQKTVTVIPCLDENGVKRVGILARDSMAGIGTITYVDPNTGEYGALGHGICETETGVLIPVREGELIYSIVSSVKEGASGDPGALQGEFYMNETVGNVEQNTQSGIFGEITDSSFYEGMQVYPVASEDEIRIGPAQILSNVSGDSTESFSIEVTQLFPADDEYGRTMMIAVTDEALIAQTGGIVQGMSGSPIIQDGKLIGAVTHVLVNDPKSGYGISVEKMLNTMEN